MSSLTRWLDSYFYPSYGQNWDDTLFREIILSRSAPHHHMLDLGAGAGIVQQMNFRGLVARVCGVDLDPRVKTNPFLDEAHVCGAEHLPHPDESFDIVIADNVVEHLPDPAVAFSEIARVLKPGGTFMFKTPNKYHYMPTAARLTPLWFHRLYNRARGRAGADTFPTLYRANTPRAVATFAKLASLEVESIKLIEGRPEYLRSFAIPYLLGSMYERAVNRVGALEPFRILLIAVLSKASADLQPKDVRRPNHGTS